MALATKNDTKDVFSLKRPTSAFLLLVMLAALCVPAAAASPKVIDRALPTNITAQIDGHPLRSYNVGNHIAVVAEDLRDYGFEVDWDETAWSLRITRGETPAVWPDYVPEGAGAQSLPVYASTIKTYVGDKAVGSFNIGGRTLVWLRDLSAFGSVAWDPEACVSSLTLGDSTVPANPVSESNKKLHILMYHSICEGAPDGLNDWTTTTNYLRKDLQWLKDNGYVTYLPSEIAAGVPLAERSVMITFDDGYRNNYALAFPILQEYGMKAVISVICDHVDVCKPDFLTWDMCREMAASGLIEFGSHTYNFHDGDICDGIRRFEGESKDEYLARIPADLRKSIDTLERETGQKVYFFAYPHGKRDSWANDFLRSNFAITVTTAHGPADLSNGLYDLPRYNINTRQPVSRFLPAAKTSAK